MSKKVLAAVLAALSFVCAPAHAGSDFTTPVTKDFWEDNIEWNGGLGRAYDFRWLVIERGGKLAVCGVGVFNDPTTRVQSKDLMRKAQVLINGTLVLTDISYFGVIKKGANLTEATATCRMSGAAEPQGNYKIRLKMGGTARF